MSVQHVYEITVIGGGPVGMFAAFMRVCARQTFCYWRVLTSLAAKQATYTLPKFSMILADSRMLVAKTLSRSSKLSSCIFILKSRPLRKYRRSIKIQMAFSHCIQVKAISAVKL